MVRWEWWAYVMPVCVLLVSSTSGIIFNSRADVIINHSQSAKDIDPYMKYQLYMDDHIHRKLILVLRNFLSKFGEQAHAKINFCHGLMWTQPVDWQPSVTTRPLPLTTMYICSAIVCYRAQNLKVVEFRLMLLIHFSVNSCIAAAQIMWHILQFMY